MEGPRPSPSTPVVLVLCEPLGGGAAAALCVMLADLVTRTGAEAAWCDIRALDRPGLRAAGVLARLRLAAGHHGCTFAVVRAPRRFVELVTLLGLRDALPCSDADRDERDPFEWWSGS